MKKSKSPYYQTCVDVYYKFYENKYKRKPQPGASEFLQLKQIISKIENILIAEDVSISIEVLQAALHKFLTIAQQDKWLAEHFNLFNLNKQFDIIISKAIKNKSTQIMANHYAEAFNKWKNK